jgi:hypothetical protein
VLFLSAPGIGDKMDFLVSVMSKDFMMNETAKKLAATDDFFKQLLLFSALKGSGTTKHKFSTISYW